MSLLRLVYKWYPFPFPLFSLSPFLSLSLPPSLITHCEESKLTYYNQPCGEAHMLRNLNLWRQPMGNWGLITIMWVKLKWIHQPQSSLEMTAFPDERLTAISGEIVSLNHATKPYDTCFYFKLLDFGIICHIVVCT